MKKDVCLNLIDKVFHEVIYNCWFWISLINSSFESSSINASFSCSVPHQINDRVAPQGSIGQTIHVGRIVEKNI